MSFLSKLSNLRKTSPQTSNRINVEESKPDDPTKISLLPKNYIRDEDPAIKRLKELRRKEQLKNGDLNKNKPKRRASPGSKIGKISTPKDSDNDRIGTVYKKKIGANTSHRRIDLQNNGFEVKKREPIKKMTFEELMKQAENNTLAPKTTPHETVKNNKSIKPKFEGSKSLNKPGFKSRGINKVSKPKDFERNNKLKNNALQSQQSVTKHKSLSQEPEPVRISLPKNKFAQPNARIKERLEKTKKRYERYNDEEDSELDDFIEDDEDDDSRYYQRQRSDRHNDNVGYDRDEIWAMFNKGKSRSDYVRRDYEEDYDDFDDMEANEMEIMDEEDHATRMAKLEDKREEAWLKKHEAEKKKKRR